MQTMKVKLLIPSVYCESVMQVSIHTYSSEQVFCFVIIVLDCKGQ